MDDYCNRLMATLVCLVYLIRFGDGLLLRALEGPAEPVTWGTDVVLHCRYELEREAGEKLYAVKWFRGRREFFRYQPQLEPPVRFFPIQHVHVDVASSSSERVVLRRVAVGTTGTYRCEVSAEGTFETDYREINITVLDTPMGDPVIYNLQSRYAVGQRLNVNCTSSESRPAARLHWLINGRIKEDRDVTQYPARWLTTTNNQWMQRPRPIPALLETSTLGLNIERLGPEYFVNGQLALTCTAQLGAHHSRSTSVRVEKEEQADNGQRRSTQQHYLTGGCNQLDGPVISVAVVSLMATLLLLLIPLPQLLPLHHQLLSSVGSC